MLRILASQVLVAALVAHAADDARLWHTTARIDDAPTRRLAVCSEQALAEVVFQTGVNDAAVPLEFRRSGNGTLANVAV